MLQLTGRGGERMQRSCFSSMLPCHSPPFLQDSDDPSFEEWNITDALIYFKRRKTTHFCYVAEANMFNCNKRNLETLSLWKGVLIFCSMWNINTFVWIIMSQQEQQEELHQVTTATDPRLPTLLFQQQERNNKLNRCCFRKTKLLNWSSLSYTVNNKSQCYEHDLPFCYQPDLFQLEDQS